MLLIFARLAKYFLGFYSQNIAMNFHLTRPRGFGRLVHYAAFILICLGGVAPAFGQTVLQASLAPTLTITGPIGSVQQIQYSTNLNNPNAWTILSNMKQDINPQLFSTPARRGKSVFIGASPLAWRTRISCGFCREPF